MVFVGGLCAVFMQHCIQVTRAVEVVLFGEGEETILEGKSANLLKDAVMPTAYRKLSINRTFL